MIDLGYVNDWSETPEIVTKCKNADHVLKSYQAGSCLWEYVCDICGYSYKVDSSG